MDYLLIYQNYDSPSDGIYPTIIRDINSPREAILKYMDSKSYYDKDNLIEELCLEDEKDNYTELELRDMFFQGFRRDYNLFVIDGDNINPVDTSDLFLEEPSTYILKDTNPMEEEEIFIIEEVDSPEEALNKYLDRFTLGELREKCNDIQEKMSIEELRDMYCHKVSTIEIWGISEKHIL